MKPPFDIIGDIHGCADQLEALLQVLGYQQRDGAYRHPGRQAIFLGDFIDRGPQQARTLDLVRPMIDGGSAHAVLGNHEFNAICYATGAGTDHVRPHTDKNTHQHAAFLREFPFGTDRHHEAIEWFKGLPIYLDLQDLGVVHACWCPDSFALLDPLLLHDHRISDELIEQYAQSDSVAYRAIERVMKGPEHPLPEALWFKDKDGHPRSSARLKWWVSRDKPMSKRLEFGGAVLSPEQLSTMDGLESAPACPLPDKPVFVGHYWLWGDPQPLSSTVACVDYSVAKGGKLTAYRWDGEAEIVADKFVSVS